MVWLILNISPMQSLNLKGSNMLDLELLFLGALQRSADMFFFSFFSQLCLGRVPRIGLSPGAWWELDLCIFFGSN